VHAASIKVNEASDVKILRLFADDRGSVGSGGFELLFSEGRLLDRATNTQEWAFLGAIH
jgi:hypothetical protein